MDFDSRAVEVLYIPGPAGVPAIKGVSCGLGPDECANLTAAGREKLGIPTAVK